MSYIEKLKDLVTAIDTSQISDNMKTRRYDFINENIARIPEYFNTVVQESTDPRLLSDVYRFSHEEDYKFLRQDYEENRRQAHILMTDAINKINRLCEKMRVSRVFETPFPDRELYSDAGSKDGVYVSESMAIDDRAVAIGLASDFSTEVFMDAADRERYAGSKDLLTELVEDKKSIDPRPLDEILASFDKKADRNVPDTEKTFSGPEEEH